MLLTSLLGGLASLLGLSGPELARHGADVGLTDPLFEPPEPEPAPAPDGPLDNAVAQQTIERWLAVKSEAVGQNHTLDRLPTVLTGVALREWQERAENARSNGWYWQFSRHEVTIEAIDINPQNSDQASVEAIVEEEGTLYENGQAVGSTDANPLTVLYRLVRQDGEWRIQDWSVQ